MSHALNKIQVLQIGTLSGEPGFCQLLVAHLQDLQIFELTDDPHTADAVLEAHGEDDDDGFTGMLLIRDRNGQPLWRSTARRPHGVSGPMAYERLLADLRAATQAGLERGRDG